MRWWWCLDDGVPPSERGLSLEGLLTGECPLGECVSTLPPFITMYIYDSAFNNCLMAYKKNPKT